MRPTDENQPASTRPNLMSARRSGGEDNILAMLERDSARGLGARLSPGARRAWYGGAAVLIVALAGALVWLASENNQAFVTPAADAISEGGPAVAQHANPAPPRQAAVIVDEPGSTAQAPSAPSAPSELPPLVLLSPNETGNANRPAPDTPAAGANVAPEAQTRIAIAAPEAQTAIAIAEPEPKARTAATPASTHSREAAPLEAPRAKNETYTPPATKARAATASRSTRPNTPMRSRKAQPGPVQRTDPEVDNDVALISAIIMHASTHSGDSAQQPEQSQAPASP